MPLAYLPTHVASAEPRHRATLSEVRELVRELLERDGEVALHDLFARITLWRPQGWFTVGWPSLVRRALRSDAHVIEVSPGVWRLRTRARARARPSR